jgi:hypothetical protein
MTMTRFRGLCAAVLIAIGFVRPAAAQSNDGWKFDFVPLYFWATELDGRLATGPVTVPVYLEFADAADNLGGAFSFHFEASRGRWGLLTDVNYIQLTSTAPFNVGGRTFERSFELDNVMFEAGGYYVVNEQAGFGVLAGLRTYTLSPTVEFTGTNTGATPIDTGDTAANAFAGVVIRPRINDKWRFIGRADIGAGEADLTWSGVVGLEYRFKPWGGLEFGYKGLGIDVKSGQQDRLTYDVTHYGPIFGLRFHWGRQ